MNALGSTLLVVLAVLSVGCAVYWLVVLERLVRSVRTLPSAARAVRDLPAAGGGGAEADLPPLAVVVPAHNEAGVIAELVRTLRAQDYPGLRVVLALDRCTDATAEIARREVGGDERFLVVEIDRCPEGWAGKVHAVHAGLAALRAAAGDEPPGLLCFTDADCSFHPSGLRAAVALLRARSLDMLSLLSTLSASSWYELVAQPAAAFELMRQFPPLRVNRADARQRPFANGQFMLFKADAHAAVGGHAAVRDALLEDIALAQRLKNAGLRGGLLAAGPIVRCRMYAGWAEFRRGWKRIYTESAGRKAKRLAGHAFKHLAVATLLPGAALLLAVGGPWLSLAVGDGPATAALLGSIGAAGVASCWGVVAAVLTLGGLPRRSALLFPVGGWLVSRILAEAAADLRRGTPTEWGGMRYARRDRSRDPGDPTASERPAPREPAQAPAGATP